ncbi:MAG: hypothetical protein ACR2PX_21510 [Endozoicomonas sp.]|uniref:hypothetical protein n=1 Tax=Endozoicomonas sp. TaxID=1892382 RepID=UPI003D9BC283
MKYKNLVFIPFTLIALCLHADDKNEIDYSFTFRALSFQWLAFSADYFINPVNQGRVNQLLITRALDGLTIFESKELEELLNRKKETFDQKAERGFKYVEKLPELLNGLPEHFPDYNRLAPTLIRLSRFPIDWADDISDFLHGLMSALLEQAEEIIEQVDTQSFNLNTSLNSLHQRVNHVVEENIVKPSIMPSSQYLSLTLYDSRHQKLMAMEALKPEYQHSFVSHTLFRLNTAYYLDADELDRSDYARFYRLAQIAGLQDITVFHIGQLSGRLRAEFVNLFTTLDKMLSSDMPVNPQRVISFLWSRKTGILPCLMSDKDRNGPIRVPEWSAHHQLFLNLEIEDSELTNLRLLGYHSPVSLCLNTLLDNLMRDEPEKRFSARELADLHSIGRQLVERTTLDKKGSVILQVSPATYLYLSHTESEVSLVSQHTIRKFSMNAFKHFYRQVMGTDFKFDILEQAYIQSDEDFKYPTGDCGVLLRKHRISNFSDYRLFAVKHHPDKHRDTTEEDAEDLSAINSCVHTKAIRDFFKTKQEQLVGEHLEQIQLSHSFISRLVNELPFFEIRLSRQEQTSLYTEKHDIKWEMEENGNTLDEWELDEDWDDH